MRNIWTIAKREYQLYFETPLAYAVAFIIYLVIGIVVATGIWGATSQFLNGSVPAPDIRMVVSPLAFFAIFLAPALTMRLISDEIRMGTMELLLTAPVRDYELITGKWLGAFFFFLTILAGTLVYAVILNNLSSPGMDQLLLISTYMGIILMVAAFLAIGTAISAAFSNQIASYLITLIVIASLWWLVGILGDVVTGGGTFLKYINLSGHFSNFLIGSINLGDIVYFLSVIIFSLFTGTMIIETRRWR